MASSYTKVLVYIASLAGLGRPYEESVGLGSYTHLFHPKMKMSTCTNFMLRCNKGEKGEKEVRGRWRIGLSKFL